MKAAIALIVIYIGTFLVAIQGASNSPVEASEQNAAETSKALDPAKEADIRSLLELLGAKDSMEDAANAATEAYRQKVIETAGTSDRARASSSAFLVDFDKRFDAARVNQQMVQIYAKHFSQEEIRGLLEFYGSPLGQKVAAEMPKAAREIQFAAQSAGKDAARQAWQDLRAESAGPIENPRPGARRRAGLAARGAQPPEQQADASQP
jgi:hypothetical protein